jgi:pyruvate dehydrogenase (quinone)
MQMNGMAELLTIARYRERWDDQRLIVAVLHNNDLNQVTWELRAMGGAPKFEESQVLPDLSYADFASSIGLDGITVRDPNDLGPAWERALESSGPTVLDVHCDPEVPPIPPHATLEEAVSMVEAVLKGDRSSLHLMMQGIKTKLQEVLP